MDAMKLAMALESTANMVAMNNTNVAGVYRAPQDTDVTYAMKVLAAQIRTML